MDVNITHSHTAFPSHTSTHPRKSKNANKKTIPQTRRVVHERIALLFSLPGGYALNASTYCDFFVSYFLWKIDCTRARCQPGE